MTKNTVTAFQHTSASAATYSGTYMLEEASPRRPHLSPIKTGRSLVSGEPSPSCPRTRGSLASTGHLGDASMTESQETSSSCSSWGLGNCKLYLVGLQIQLFLVILTVLCCQTSGARTSRCYSCMSPIYSPLWTEFRYDQIYMNQMDFTPNCRDPDSARGVRWRDCEGSCLKMEDIFSNAGQVTKAYIRGCYSSFFAWGFNRSSIIANRLEYRDMCGNYSLGMLTPRLPTAQHKSHTVYTCSCHGDLCNAAPQSGHATTSAQRIVAISVTLMLLTIFQACF